MNILMINGTMRKSSTYKLARLLIEKIAAPEDTVKEIFLPKDMPEFCRGCATCIMTDEKKCPDYLIYMRGITELIDAADLLVFTTPVFVFHATGQMKALLDHYGYRWMVHRPEASMFQKQAICVCTGAGGGMKKAMRDITDSLRYWGVARIHTYGTVMKAGSWEEMGQQTKDQIEADLNKLAVKIIRDRDQVKPSLFVKVLFYIVRSLQINKGFHKKDVEYWHEKGWLGKKRPWKKQ